MIPVRHTSPLLQLNRVHDAIGDVRARLDSAQTAASTGLRVTRPSDAPGVWSRVLSLQSSLDASVLHGTNAAQTLPLLDTADAAMSTALETLVRAGELAVQGASEALSDDQLPLIADEVDALISSLVSVGNTKFGDRYLFGGTASGVQPFDAAGTYVGNSTSPTVRVSESVWIDTGFDGSSAFGAAIAALMDLSAALRTGDQSLVQAEIDNVQGADTGIIALQGKIGVAWNQADDATVAGESARLFLQAQIDGLIGTDPTEALTELTAAQAAYETVLAVSAQVFEKSLFDFL